MGEEELHCSLLMSKQKLDLIDILREAAAIPCKNIKFLIFSLLISLPLFCFLLFFDTVLHKTLLKISNFVSQDPYTWGQSSVTSLWNVFPELVQFCLLYLVPYQLLELFSAVMTVDAASDIYSGAGGKNKRLSLIDMILKTFDNTRLIGIFFTFLYVTLLSTAALIGLVWIVIDYHITSGGFTPYFYGLELFEDDSSVMKIILAVVHGSAFLALLRKYLEWSAGWNMSIVISVQEEACGAKALEGSDYFIRGSEARGSLMMLVFFTWVVVLRLPCLYLGCSGKNGVLTRYVVIALACLGNAMKWVALWCIFMTAKQRFWRRRLMWKWEEKLKLLVNNEQVLDISICFKCSIPTQSLA